MVEIPATPAPSAESTASSPVVPPGHRRVEIIDYLRLFAAVSVVAFHYLYDGIVDGYVDGIPLTPLADVVRYGELGVDLFFMISGYVILASVAGKTARQFAVGRALRLYPAFWVAVLLTSAFAVVLGGDRMGVTLPQVLANLTMVPNYLGQENVDVVYWTLVYELQFYALVFLFLLFRQGHRVAAVMPGWAIGMLVLTVAAPELSTSKPFLGGYFAWFAAGAIVATVASRGWTVYRVLGLLAAFLTVTGFELSIPAAIRTAIFATVLATVLPAVRSWTLPRSALAGALTYPLYLVHAYIGYMLLNLLVPVLGPWASYAVVVVVVAALAYTLHRVVERSPVARRFWKALLEASAGRAVALLQRGVDRVLPGRSEGARRLTGQVVTDAPDVR